MPGDYFAEDDAAGGLLLPAASSATTVTVRASSPPGRGLDPDGISNRIAYRVRKDRSVGVDGKRGLSSSVAEELFSVRYGPTPWYVRVSMTFRPNLAQEQLMRSVVLIAILVLAQQLTTASSRQSTDQSGGASASAAEHDAVRRLSERALKPASGAEFIELADDDLILCNAAGQITTIAQVRRGVAQGATLQGPANDAQISELKVQLYGDTAIVAGVLSAQPPAASGSSGTARAPIDGRVLLVWIKHGETWKLHAMQTTMIARRPQ